MSEDRIKVTVEGGVADVRMVRTDKMNALDNPMFEALANTGEALKKRNDVRCVVLSGEGRAFCAGLDMGNFSQMANAGQKGEQRKREEEIIGKREYGNANRAQQVAMVWKQIPVPVIAAVHGVAFGGGFQVMLGADMRYVTPDVKLAILEIKWGLIPDMAGLVLTRKICRADILRELTFTGRIFNGHEAKEYGFATKVVADPHAEAMATARDIASKNPHAIRAGKRLLNLAEDASEGEILMAETDEQVALISSPNQVEAVMASLQKRDAKFADVA
ncbi:MAG TPA: crotonase/enoyl-CoA hydratase family protein [Rhizomicrobium sp.]|jgi:enoyl-CoA hydratase/carnithine racemase|nr:crotonase/enoyl-CoA hydratase family protein [Rhizomicrobium sp.]